MGAWGVLAFDNDDANDWAYDLEEADDLCHFAPLRFGQLRAVLVHHFARPLDGLIHQGVQFHVAALAGLNLLGVAPLLRVGQR